MAASTASPSAHPSTPGSPAILTVRLDAIYQRRIATGGTDVIVSGFRIPRHWMARPGSTAMAPPPMSITAW
jgi:hypothetical protein